MTYHRIPLDEIEFLQNFTTKGYFLRTFISATFMGWVH